MAQPNEFGGKWITTYTGKQFHFLDPQPDEIRIEDIAHALSLTCRFGGQCSVFYSVGEHSIRGTTIVPAGYELLFLLHDSDEAYLPDLPRPMKAELPAFKKMGLVIRQAVWDKYVPNNRALDLNIIKEADNILLATEARDLMNNMDDWAELPLPLAQTIVPLSSAGAEALFLKRFKELSSLK